jgi:phosphoglycolate/pyridoxal phosphate phosphatase family enzyme
MHSAASLSHLEAFIFDLDGVIWKGNAPIQGAVESVARLRAAGKRVFYCTNNSRRGPGEFAETLRSLDIECEDEDVMTSSTATSLYLQSLFTGPYTAYVVGEDGLIQTIRRTGAIVMTSPIVPQRSDLHDNHGAVDCVIVGLDATFTYHKLRVAQRLVMGGARFIATNRDATFPTPYGLVPGAGTIVAAIETATGVTPVTLGKPQPFMAQLLMQKYGLAPETTCMVGDRLDTDIAAARRAHITALLVTTGVHSREMGERAKNLQKPDAIYDDLPSLCDAVLSGTTEPASAEAKIVGTIAPVAVTAAVIAADAAQHEPAAVLETPFAEETAAVAPLIFADDLVPVEANADEVAVEEFSAEALEFNEPDAAPLPLDVPAGAAPDSTETPAFSFDDEPPFAATEASPSGAADADAVDKESALEAPPEEAPFAFDFDMPLTAGEAPAATAAAEASPDAAPVALDEVALDEAPAEVAEEESAEADDAEAEPAENTNDKWWESLDNI